MVAVPGTWREPIVVLDAAGALPVDVDRSPATPTRFTTRALELIDDLTSTLVPTTHLSTRIQELGLLALGNASLLRPELPDAALSADATTRLSEGLRPNEVEERIRYDEFFGIRRAENIDANTLAFSIFVSVGETLVDLAGTQIGLHEIVALLRGMTLITGWVDGTAKTDSGPPALSGDVPEGALLRFRLGHLVFALLCDFGYHFLEKALIRVAREESPTDELSSAAVCVRGSTASMWYAVTVPSAMYLGIIRPLMDAASSKDHGFSGLDNFDFRRMRESWEGLVVPLSQRLRAAPSDDALQGRAHELYETILEDNEHHILLAAEMVGVRPSLKYERLKGTVPGAGGVPAVAALRMNADERRALLEQVAGL